MIVTKKVAVLTESGNSLVLNVRMSDTYTLPVLVERYVKPLLNERFVCSIEGKGVWVGHSEWHYKYDNNENWQKAMALTGVRYYVNKKDTSF